MQGQGIICMCNRDYIKYSCKKTVTQSPASLLLEWSAQDFLLKALAWLSGWLKPVHQTKHKFFGCKNSL